MKSITVLFEDEDIIVCEKEAGVPSQSDKSRDADMVSLLKNYEALNQEEDREPFIGLVHRLDRPVGGIMVFAKSQYALSELNKQVQTKKIKKGYKAVSTANAIDKISNDRIKLIDYLQKDSRTNTSKIAKKDEKDAKLAELFYKVVDVKEGFSLIEIELLTGRHHQIRVQLANAKLPLWGDLKYNNDNKTEKWTNVALYSGYLEFIHPRNKKKMIFKKEPECYPFTLFKR